MVRQTSEDVSAECISALLAIRIEFLADDWLWLINPTGKREGLEAMTQTVPMLIMPLLM